ncbi:hypothetical protein [Stutzerimonas stutzeri]|nr:hypothetical protein [Stutzerimonas stutzeri]MDH0059381.1 hypothetical protein [Stutzerimonas stutzeri]
MDEQLAKQNAAASLIGRTDEARGRARFGTMYIFKEILKKTSRFW